MKSQHTRGIWKSDGELDEIQIYTGEKNKGYHRIALISGNSYEPPNYEEVEANAERIVHCVNNFDDLLQALKEVEQCLDNVFQKKNIHLPISIMKAYDIINKTIKSTGQ